MPQALPTSPAAERNKGPILDVLQSLLPPEARVLEVASGTGQHAAHCAAAQPRWRWQPSDGDAAALPTIAERCAHLPNVAPPRHLDLLALSGDAADAAAAFDGQGDARRQTPFDAVFAANLLHISPWPTCAALMQLAATCLRAGGLLVVYGPFDVEGEPLAPSNRAFDADLRARDARWGLRRLGDVQAEAARAGLGFEQRRAMPANNLVLVWRRDAGAAFRGEARSVGPASRCIAGMALPAVVAAKQQPLSELCLRRAHVRRLDLFGSAVRSDFDPERSDLDFVVEFVDLPPVEYANAFFELKEGLESLFRRPVDLVVERAIRNPHFKARVDRERQSVHAP